MCVIEIADDLDISLFTGDSSSFNDKRSIWNVMIKHCVLFGIALLSNQLWYVSVLVDIQSIQYVIDHWTSVLLRVYVLRAVENLINIIILWLVLKVNNDKYVCLCKCWHKCILRYCMREDPNIIREGFCIMNNEQGNDIPLMTGLNGKVEGHDLIITGDVSSLNGTNNRIEGRDRNGTFYV